MKKAASSRPFFFAPALSLQGSAGQHPIGFEILLGGLLHHVGREFRPGRGLVPVERLEVIAHILLVEADRACSDLVLVGGPEPARIRGQDLVNQNDFAVKFAEFEFRVCDDDAALLGIIPGRRIDFERKVTQRGCLGRRRSASRPPRKRSLRHGRRFRLWWTE